MAARRKKGRRTKRKARRSSRTLTQRVSALERGLSALKPKVRSSRRKYGPAYNRTMAGAIG